ncbi:hypothetical protein ACRALDRAFT_208617 [Sodiomyces alcalophilus JCM 7366]|uniref:uncharacterized protein n=1 Tax=Sodiomyces alcalophilus JCM 7366 TaxID=591952 RepID=UPI0039B694AB
MPDTKLKGVAIFLTITASCHEIRRGDAAALVLCFSTCCVPCYLGNQDCRVDTCPVLLYNGRPKRKG